MIRNDLIKKIVVKLGGTGLSDTQNGLLEEWLNLLEGALNE